MLESGGRGENPMSKFSVVCILGAIGVSVLAGAPSGAGVVKSSHSKSQAVLDPQGINPFKTFSTSKNGGTSIVVSDHGNILSWESPTGYGHVLDSVGNGEGYVVCYTGAFPVQAFDIGPKENTSAWGRTTPSLGPPGRV